MDMGFLAGMCALLPRGVARSLLRTWAFEQLGGGGVFFPLRRLDTRLRCVETWKYFPTWRCAFSRGGVFSHVQGEVFLPPWTHVGSLKEFLWGFVPQNPVPSCLLPPPPSSHPLETLEVVCSQTATLGHRTTQGGAWEVARKSQPPCPAPSPPAPAKHVYPPWHK